MSQILFITRTLTYAHLHRGVPLRVWTTAVKVTAKSKDDITKKPRSPIAHLSYNSDQVCITSKYLDNLVH